GLRRPRPRLVIRGVMAALVPALAVALTAAWVLRTPAQLPARFALEGCRRVDLIDNGTGRRIAGVEDLALAHDGATLVLSAQDRLDTTRPEGGLYAVSLFALGAGQGVRAQPLVAPREGDFRPHGIAISPDGRRLAVVNHVSS